MHELLPALHFGESWRDAAPRLFDGNGSFGNAAAMRVAPLGAYFADDLEQVLALAERPAVVTHAHPEAAAGAIAVAVAPAYGVRSCVSTRPRGWRAFLDSVLPHVPESEVRTRLQKARDLRSGLEIGKVVARLGNGTMVSAQDTVPFVLWCAAHHLRDFERAIWKVLSGMGDLDTNAAMVGVSSPLRSGGRAYRAHGATHGSPYRTGCPHPEQCTSVV
jgi:ADP-ribosylglycohydrolase